MRQSSRRVFLVATLRNERSLPFSAATCSKQPCRGDHSAPSGLGPRRRPARGRGSARRHISATSRCGRSAPAHDAARRCHYPAPAGSRSSACSEMLGFSCSEFRGTGMAWRSTMNPPPCYQIGHGGGMDLFRQIGPEIRWDQGVTGIRMNPIFGSHEPLSPKTT